MKGKLYGVGVGPGDRELLTLKAVRIINQCEYIAVPKSHGSRQLALEICEEYINGKGIVHCETPMSYNEQTLTNSYEENSRILEDILSKGNDVAFLTIGDPAVYSTFVYIEKLISAKGFATQIIPGVTSFCSGAASANIALCEKDQALHIIPASYNDYEGIEKLKGTLVFMKSGKKLAGLIGMLKEKGKLGNCILVENSGMENERVIKDLGNLPEDIGYFSLVICKEEL